MDSIPERDDIQIIVVDDNSDADKKPQLSRKDVEVILLDAEHSKGAGRARNVGLQHMTRTCPLSYQLIFNLRNLNKHSKYIKKELKFEHLLVGWFIFILLFFVLRPLQESFEVESSMGLLNKIAILSERRLCQLLYATSGTICLFLSSVYYTRDNQLRPFIIKFGFSCFGIYLIQQFLLKELYFKTNFAVFVGPYWLPWLGFLIAVPLSYALSLLLLKTKAGRSLIG